MDRLGKCLLRWPPASVEPSTNHIHGNSKMFSKFSHASSHATDRKDSAIPLVSRLLNPAFPATVSRFIVPIVVYPSNRHAVWRLAHVGKKARKITPPLTHADPPSAIVTKRVVGRISASVDHVLPNTVSPGMSAVERMSMLNAGGINHCLFGAPTGLGVAAEKAVQFKDLHSAAFTSALNPSLNSSVRTNAIRGISEDLKLSKFETDNYFSSRHGIGPFNVIVSGGPGDYRDRCDSIKPSKQFNNLAS